MTHTCVRWLNLVLAMLMLGILLPEDGQWVKSVTQWSHAKSVQLVSDLSQTSCSHFSQLSQSIQLSQPVSQPVSQPSQSLFQVRQAVGHCTEVSQSVSYSPSQAVNQSVSQSISQVNYQLAGRSVYYPSFHKLRNLSDSVLRPNLSVIYLHLND
jgi:hypothetical protein